MTEDVLSSAVPILGSTLIVAAFLRGSRRPDTGRRGVLLSLGLAAVILAMSGPVEAWAEESFAAHMVQHLALILVAAPLLVLADPVPPVLAGLRARVRRPVASVRREVHAAGITATPPVVAFVVHLGTVVVWHAPALFDAAVGNDALHALEHASFFGTGLLFWAPILTARGRRRITDAAAVFYVIGAGLVGTALGALLTLASTPWYETYVARRGVQAALADQQLAGLIMWIPPGIVYVAVAAVVLRRRLERTEPAADDRVRTYVVGGSHET